MSGFVWADFGGGIWWADLYERICMGGFVWADLYGDFW